MLFSIGLINWRIYEFWALVGIFDVDRDFLNHADFCLSAIDCGDLVGANVDFVSVVGSVVVCLFKVWSFVEVQNSEGLISNLYNIKCE